MDYCNCRSINIEVLPRSEYYMGYEIIPHPSGFSVSHREDSSRATGLKFSSIIKAMRYINKAVGLG